MYVYQNMGSDFTVQPKIRYIFKPSNVSKDKMCKKWIESFIKGDYETVLLLSHS